MKKMSFLLICLFKDLIHGMGYEKNELFINLFI
jgi:hypothetical protein